VLPFTLNNERCSRPRKPSWQRRSWPLYCRGKDEAPVPITRQGPPAAAGGSHRATEALKHGPAGSRWRAYVGGSRSGRKPERGLCESLGIMQKIILMLLLTACTASAIATNKAIAQKPAVQDKVACYNVITGRTFSAAECDLRVCRGTDGSARQFSGIQGHYGDGYGPCIRPREEGESNSEIDCKFGPGFLVSRGKPVQAFSSPICAEAKVEFRQCLNGTMLGSYQYPDCQ
jgi:hypothetical protein